MSTVTIPATCTCGSIGRTDLRQCPDHFRIYKGDVRLASVGSILRDCWPKELCKCGGLGFDHKSGCVIGEKIENAKDRGGEVDKLFAAYVLGKLERIPSGTRTDARDLLLKLIRWYDAKGFKKVEAQVLLGARDYGGVLDFRFDGLPVDLKCTYNVEQTAIMQVAGYSDLCMCSAGAVLHVTERLKEPELIPLTQDDLSDWDTMLAQWRMLKRRGALKELNAPS